MASTSTKEVKKHHKKLDVCYKRPGYRESRWEKAVRVYTINQESKYVIVVGVPAVGATKELLQQFALYGDIEEYRHLDEYPVEEFTEAYWIKYKRIQSARHGKKKMDNRSFFGGLLHVFYAPEYESVDDTRCKLMERKRSVLRKCQEYFGEDNGSSKKSNQQQEQSHSTETHSTPQTTTPTSRLASLWEPPSDHLVSQRPSPSNYTIPKPPVHNHKEKINNFTTPDINQRDGRETRLPEFPRVPTKQASLPVELQMMSTKEVYPSQETSQFLEEKKEAEKAKQTELLKERRQSEKKIVWNINAPVNPFAHAHQYTKEPGAWNPHPEEKGNRNFGENTFRTSSDAKIIRKLIQTAEPSQNIVSTEPEISPLDMPNPQQIPEADHLPAPPPVKKKRANDGRKRI